MHLPRVAEMFDCLLPPGDRALEEVDLTLLKFGGPDKAATEEEEGCRKSEVSFQKLQNGEMQETCSKLQMLERTGSHSLAHCRGMLQIRAQGAVSLLLLSSSVHTILLTRGTGRSISCVSVGREWGEGKKWEGGNAECFASLLLASVEMENCVVPPSANSVALTEKKDDLGSSKSSASVNDYELCSSLWPCWALLGLEHGVSSAGCWDCREHGVGTEWESAIEGTETPPASGDQRFQ
ncbi:hypothetical protein EK904_009752, partial [Melospiza melodia maxima]